jgi:hypothetical protein|nr:MAG TPA: hypothetical protein [Caudoviricetes sp.]
MQTKKRRTECVSFLFDYEVNLALLILVATLLYHTKEESKIAKFID